MNFGRYLKSSVLSAVAISAIGIPVLAMTSDYTGTVGKNKIGLNFDSEISTAKGTFKDVYYYVSTLKDIPVSAESDGLGSIIIKAKDPTENSEEIFKGNFKKAETGRKPGTPAFADDSIDGTWTKGDSPCPFH